VESKLKGMGIFCGSGSFDRGLEEGGSIEFKWGVDWAERALHSYRANTREPQNLNLFLGSVNDHLGRLFTVPKTAELLLSVMSMCSQPDLHVRVSLCSNEIEAVTGLCATVLWLLRFAPTSIFICQSTWC
jgi:site-specific DNA-cytosine methylase